MDSAELKQVIHDTINELYAVHECYPEVHRKFVEMQIKREERRQKLWMNFKLSFIGGLALVVLGWLMWMGTVIVEHLGIHIR